LKEYGREHLIRGISMKIQSVLQPSSTKEAKKLLFSIESSKVLAGGTDLIIDMRKGKVKEETFIDITKVEALKYIKNFQHHTVLGSAVTFSDMLNCSVLKEKFTLLRHCSEMMGSPQIRNRATVGGNIINAAAACDIVPCLMSLEAVLVIEDEKCRRLVRIEDYFEDYEKHRIKPQELLISVIINYKGYLSGFYKLGKRNSLSIGRVNAAVALELEDTKVKTFRLALGAVGRFPYRVYDVEAAVASKEIDYLFSDQIMAILQKKVDESIKGRPTLPFKREAVKGVYLEALRRALEKEGVLYEQN
jgi:CO/xanthine dehydrogenase FAD-binding subunit